MTIWWLWISFWWLSYAFGVYYTNHCVLLKNYPYSELFCPHFPVFGLNTETYRVSLCIQSECGKMRTRITPNTETFHAVVIILELLQKSNWSKVSKAKKKMKVYGDIKVYGFCQITYAKNLTLIDTFFNFMGISSRWLMKFLFKKLEFMTNEAISHHKWWSLHLDLPGQNTVVSIKLTRWWKIIIRKNSKFFQFSNLWNI